MRQEEGRKRKGRSERKVREGERIKLKKKGGRKKKKEGAQRNERARKKGKK